MINIGTVEATVGWATVIRLLQQFWLPDTEEATESQAADWTLVFSSDVQFVAALNRKLANEPCIAHGHMWSSENLDDTACRIEAAFRVAEGLPNVNWLEVADRFDLCQPLWVPEVNDEALSESDHGTSALFKGLSLSTPSQTHSRIWMSWHGYFPLEMSPPIQNVHVVTLSSVHTVHNVMVYH